MHCILHGRILKQRHLLWPVEHLELLGQFVLYEAGDLISLKAAHFVHSYKEKISYPSFFAVAFSVFVLNHKFSIFLRKTSRIPPYCLNLV